MDLLEYLAEKGIGIYLDGNSLDYTYEFENGQIIKETNNAYNTIWV